MLIFLQFTLTDLRPFTQEAANMLVRPTWPDPDIDCEFIRNGGVIVERKSRGVGSWVGEGRICKVGKGIVINKNKIGKRVSLNNFSKHIYTSRQKVLTKYEFVFSVTGAPKTVNSGLINEIVRSVFQSEVRLKRGSSFYYHRVLGLTKVLKGFHLESTTIYGKHTKEELVDYILHSSPQLYFYLDRDEQLELSARDFVLIAQKQYSLFGAWRKIENQTVRIWIHQRLTSSSLIDFNRVSRITIMRLHSEFECLRSIFKAIGNKVINVIPGSEASDALQDYFNNAITTFLRAREDVSVGSQEGFLDYFSQVMAQFMPGELTSIVNQIKSFNFRRQIKEKALYFINMGDNFIFKGEVNAMSIGNNNTLENSTQNIQKGVLTETDYPALFKEIQELKAQLLKENNLSATMSAVLDDTEAAIVEKNNNRIFEALKKGGVWLFEFAGRVGATLVAAILKDKLGL